MSIDTIIAELRAVAQKSRDGKLSGIAAQGWFDIFADQLSACRTAEAVAHRWSRDGVPTGGWIDGIPSQRQFEAQVQCKDLANWTVEYAYAHPAKEVPEGEKPEWYRRECDNVDEIIRKLGLDPERVRTEGGALIVQRILNHIQETSDALADASVKLAAVFGTAHPAPVASRVTVDEAMVELACETYWVCWNTPAYYNRGSKAAKRKKMRAALEAALTPENP